MRGRLVDEIAEVIGQPAVMALCRHFGGTRVYVPVRMTPQNPIAEVIGIKAAKALAEVYSGTTIDLPKAHARRARVIELAKSGTMTIQAAALACDYSERRVYQLLAELREDDGQLSLFPGMS